MDAKLFEEYALGDIIIVEGCPAGTCCSWVIHSIKVSVE